MAIASIRTTPISRGKGKCSIAASAYRSAEELTNEQDGQTYDYTRKQSVAYTEIFAPEQAPLWVYDRQTLWNEVERSETRCNSRTAREIRIALPIELTLEQNIAAARAYAQTFANQGMIADLAIHDSKGNPHAHLMLTTRAINEEGFQEKVREWDKKEALQRWHKNYEKVINYHLEKAGRPERIDIRSYAEQGIEKIPTVHLGHISHEQEQRGEHTIRGDRNRAIEEHNRQIQELNATLAKVEALQEQEREAQKIQQQAQHHEPAQRNRDNIRQWEQQPHPAEPERSAYRRRYEEQYKGRRREREQQPERKLAAEKEPTSSYRRRYEPQQEQQPAQQPEPQQHHEPVTERGTEQKRGYKNLYSTKKGHTIEKSKDAEPRSK